MNHETTNTTSQVRGLVQAALFAALIILMAMVPFLGISRSDSHGQRSSTFL